MTNETFRCIVCKKALENVFPNSPDRLENQPSQGVAFMSQGHYGSTIFDPMDGTSIEINVCDGCLALARDAGDVMHRATPPYPPRSATSVWTATE